MATCYGELIHLRQESKSCPQERDPQYLHDHCQGNYPTSPRSNFYSAFLVSLLYQINNQFAPLVEFINHPLQSSFKPGLCLEARREEGWVGTMVRSAVGRRTQWPPHGFADCSLRKASPVLLEQAIWMPKTIFEMRNPLIFKCWPQIQKIF